MDNHPTVHRFVVLLFFYSLYIPGSSFAFEAGCDTATLFKLQKKIVTPDFATAILNPQDWKSLVAHQAQTLAILEGEKKRGAWKRTLRHFISTVVPIKTSIATRKTNSFIELMSHAELSGSEKSELWDEYVKEIRYEVETEVLNRILKKGYSLDESRRQAALHAQSGFHSESYQASDGSYIKVGNDGELLIFETTGDVYLGKSNLTS